MYGIHRHQRFQRKRRLQNGVLAHEDKEQEVLVPETHLHVEIHLDTMAPLTSQVANHLQGRQMAHQPKAETTEVEKLETTINRGLCQRRRRRRLPRMLSMYMLMELAQIRI